MEIKLVIEGMTCAGCKASVSKALLAVTGVQNVTVSLENHSATVDFDDKLVSLAEIKTAIEDAGYDISHG